MKRQSILCILIAFFVLAVPDIWAGGPLFVSSGEPVVWQEENLPVVYQIDQGDLGTLRSFSARSMIDDAFEEWESVARWDATSFMRFERESDLLSEDVTGDNYLRVTRNLDSDITPIIFDDDGSIMEMILGSGAKENYLGLTRTSTSGNRMVYVEIILNGYFFEENGFNREDMLTTVIHEIGHLCGLDHSQYSRHLANNLVNADDEFLSMMYPQSSDDDSSRLGLTFDDKIAISNLYPTNRHINSSGSIQGVVKRGNQELPGVNVVVRDIEEPFSNVATTVTGTYERGRGTYELRGLPPGEYELKVEAIDEDFTGASSVGQYSDSLSDLSFRRRIRSEYYNTGDQENEGRSTLSAIPVRSLRTTSDIDLQVDSESLPSNEESIELLAIDLPTMGGAAVGYYSFYQFLLHPSGDEGRIEVNFEYNRNLSHLIEYRRELPNGRFEEETINRSQRTDTIVLGEGGDMPLENTRYFFRVGNAPRQSSDLEFTILASQQATFTPTKTTTPSKTPTQKKIPTSISTETPTSTPIPTSTPSPTATQEAEPNDTPTPTPIRLKGDVNEDGVVNALDLFYFSSEWQNRTWQNYFESDIYKDEEWRVNILDLLELIEALKSRHKDGD